MGLLTKGTPLQWEDSLEHLNYVRQHGILQFLSIYHSAQSFDGDELKYGDEIEYGIFELDHVNHTARISLRGDEIIKELNEKETKNLRMDRSEDGCNWVYEYGAWMVESTPKKPYGGFVSDLGRVEENMRLRRTRLLAALKANEIAPTVTAFPLLGTVDCVAGGKYQIPGNIAQSIYLPDEVICSHPRFGTLTANIRKRRGRKIDIRIPVFQDVYTHTNTLSSDTAKIDKNDSLWAAEISRPTYISSKPNEKKNFVRREEIVYESNGASDAIKTEQTTEKGSKMQSMSSPRNYVHMDCMAFGMGMCCLQVTFQAKNLGESRRLYDQLAVLAPVMLALTAATPILKGTLVDTDARWATVAASVDDRTPQEMLAPGSTTSDKRTKYLPKSRYEGISTYISDRKTECNEEYDISKYNDVYLPIDDASYETLTSEGIDPPLSHHIAHLFVRDPLVIFSERIFLDDSTENDHFESIQSTNWQTVRWKPPPKQLNVSSCVPSPVQFNQNEAQPTWNYTSMSPTAIDTNLKSVESRINRMQVDVPSPSVSSVLGSSASSCCSPRKEIGWRVEFRSMEVQLTDFENAAFTVFIILLSRVILAFDLNLYIPLSKVNANMETAHRVDAVHNEKFFFRSHLAPPNIQEDCTYKTSENKKSSCKIHGDPNRYEPMSIDEIMTGKGTYFPGLLPLIRAYLDYIEIDDENRCIVEGYMTFIEQRSCGKVMTTASWIRKFVRSHPSYQHDSIVNQKIAYDLLCECAAIGEGKKRCPEIYGDDVFIQPIKNTKPYETPLLSKTITDSEDRKRLLQRYAMRSKLKTTSCYEHNDN